MRSDVNFDGFATDFETEIYGSSKGYIRLRVLWGDLLSQVPEIVHGGLAVLDAGGGSGHLALRLARLGNRVTLSDASREMLNKAQTALDRAGLSDRVTLVHAPIQELDRVLARGFDLIICHAVLEWLADPRSALVQLAQLLDHHGRLSLMFYNRNAALLKRVFRGQFDAALQEASGDVAPRGWGDGCTPLSEATVRAWIVELGLTVTSKAGIRIFHDHVPESARKGEGLDQLLAVETALRNHEPFASLGQHIHLVCEPIRRPPSHVEDLC